MVTCCWSKCIGAFFTGVGGGGGVGVGGGGGGVVFFFNDTATTEIYTLSLHDALPICYFTGNPFSIGTQQSHTI